MEGKVCTKCKQWKPLEEYHKKKASKDGRNSQCKSCKSEENKKYKKDNKDKIKQWKEENKEKIKEKRKERHEKNKEKENEQSRKYYENNKEKVKENSKRWREENKDKVREYARKQYEKNKDNEALKEKRRERDKRNADKLREQKRLWEIKHKEEKSKREKERYITTIKPRYEKNKNENIKNITDLVTRIKPIFKELNLPVYGTIYKFENIKTRKAYIGQTILPLEQRYGKNIIKNWIKERKESTLQKFNEELNEKDIKVTEVLAVGCCKYHLDKLEVFYINKYNSFNEGYNNNAGHHNTSDGIEEFYKILKDYNLLFVDGELIENCSQLECM